MIKRPYWQERIEIAWESRSIIWLSGVRRVGKTTLALSLPRTKYYDCDLPSVVRRLEDPESFFHSHAEGSRLILDEIQRLPDPSDVLKIAADAFAGIRVIATGSSTLAATRKFRDSLAGRKWNVLLCPVLWDECRDGFAVPDLDERLLRGGLPQPLVGGESPEAFFAEWSDSHYARDIAELFGLRDRAGFMNLLMLLGRQSGGLADTTKLAREAALSRPTVRSYMEAMTTAHSVFVLRPFHGAGRREIVHRPKIYAFDTGFVAAQRGWSSIREEDRGLLWEHLVLDTLRASGIEPKISFWRDKTGNEIDFVIHRGGGLADAIECKVDPGRFDPANHRLFRSFYPEGENWVVSPWEEEDHTRRVGGLTVRFLSTRHILERGAPTRSRPASSET